MDPVRYSNLGGTTRRRTHDEAMALQQKLRADAEIQEMKGDYQELAHTLARLGNEFCCEKSEYELGLMYMEGRGSSMLQDFEKADYWLESSNQRGYYLATLKLGDLHHYSEIGSKEKAVSEYHILLHCLHNCHPTDKNKSLLMEGIINNIERYKDNPFVMEIAVVEFKYLTENYARKPEVIKIIASYISDNIEKYDGSTLGTKPIATIRDPELLKHTVRFIFENYWTYNSTETPLFIKLRNYTMEQFFRHSNKAYDDYGDLRGRIYLRNFLTY